MEILGLIMSPPSNDKICTTWRHHNQGLDSSIHCPQRMKSSSTSNQINPLTPFFGPFRVGPALALSPTQYPPGFCCYLKKARGRGQRYYKKNGLVGWHWFVSCNPKALAEVPLRHLASWEVNSAFLDCSHLLILRRCGKCCSDDLLFSYNDASLPTFIAHPHHIQQNLLFSWWSKNLINLYTFNS